MSELATLTANRVRMVDSGATFIMHSEPTALQQRCFDLLEVNARSRVSYPLLTAALLAAVGYIAKSGAKKQLIRVEGASRLDLTGGKEPVLGRRPGRPWSDPPTTLADPYTRTCPGADISTRDHVV